MQLTDNGSCLLSRVAEAAYWAGRHLERAETTSRLVRAHTELFLDLPRSVGIGWTPLLAVLGAGEDFGRLHRDADEETVVGFLVAEVDDPSSVVASIEAVRNNLRVARPVLPLEGAEILNELADHVRATAPSAIDRVNRLMWLTDLIRRCQTLNGLLHDSMCHDAAYAFLTMGRLVERADMTTRVLDVQAGVLIAGRGRPALDEHADLCWASALRSLDALDSYRRRYRGTSPEEAIAFLLRDPQFPRSVESCLTQIARLLLELPCHEAAMAAGARAQMVLGSAPAGDLAGHHLRRFVDQVQDELAGLHRAVATTWLVPGAAPTPPLLAARPEVRSGSSVV